MSTHDSQNLNLNSNVALNPEELAEIEHILRQRKTPASHSEATQALKTIIENKVEYANSPESLSGLLEKESVQYVDVKTEDTKEVSSATDFLHAGLNILDQRGRLRDTTKGQNKERSMAKIVQIFNLLYDKDITVEQGWAFMVVLKQVRSATGKYSTDSYVDGLNYFALMGEAASETKDLRG